MKLNKLRALIFAALLVGPGARSFAGTIVSITVAPPALPVYAQPVCPGDGYIWTPGYGVYGPNGYYWVPGTWVLAPRPGYLWTPGYWGWAGGFYLWHAGYWGLHVGFYGGVNYGFGYTGFGFHGGYWEHDRFYYNRSVTNVNITNIHNTYNKVVIENNHSRTSFNGHRGIESKPRNDELRAEREHHLGATPGQLAHERKAGADPTLLASANKGRPATAATGRPRSEHALTRNAAVHGKGANRNMNPSHSTLAATKSHAASRPNVAHPQNSLHSSYNAGHPAGGAHSWGHRGRR